MDFLVLLHHLLVLTFYAQLKPALDLLMSLQRAQLSDKRLFNQCGINVLNRTRGLVGMKKDILARMNILEGLSLIHI